LYLAPPDNPVVITRNGNAVTLLVQAFVSEDPIFCIYPGVPVSFAIGAFAPGNYAVQVEVQYDTFPEGLVTQTLGALPFTVTALDAAPSRSAWASWTLMVLLLFVTATHRRIEH
jgi:hypothetical protein